MISDVLSNTNEDIRRYQIEMPEIYGDMQDRLDRVRCDLIILQMELDCQYPIEYLKENPIYKAAMEGDPGPSDAYMDGDDSILTEWRKVLDKRLAE